MTNLIVCFPPFFLQDIRFFVFDSLESLDIYFYLKLLYFPLCRNGLVSSNFSQIESF